MSEPLTRLRSALAGRYAIERLIGEGGMATVYLAHDERHDRHVALKLLKPELARAVGAKRFLAEIRTTANLQHPNILPLFDSGNARDDQADGDLLFYVMPFVRGESLRDRLDREGPLPVDEAVRIATAIAEALSYAHRQGVIHRDIKPQNVLLDEGRPLVADFGIALATDPGDDTPLTRTGIMVGTPQYMSPEQATGDSGLDRRTDIYALGCVAHEMLTGRLPYTGPTTGAIVARALLGDVRPLRELRRNVPVHVDAAVRTALEPLPADRFQDAAAFATALSDRNYRRPEEAAVATGRRRRWLVGAAWTLSLVAAVSVSEVVRRAPGGGVPTGDGAPLGAPTVSRFAHVLPEDQSFSSGSHPVVTVSPLGSPIVYAANNRLYRRDVDRLEATPVRGSEGDPASPFFSPDGSSVAYWDAAAGELRRISISGGAPVSVAPATTLYGGSWGNDGTIVYGQSDGIWRVPAAGGPAERLLAIEPNEFAYGPRFLPDGETLLFSLVASAAMVGQSTAWDSARVVLYVPETGERTELLRGADPRYLPTGHLAFALDTVLFAVPFDVESRQLRGGPVPVLENVQRTIRGSGGQAGGGQWDFARNGTLVYVPTGTFAGSVGVPKRLVTVDRDGSPRPLLDEERDYWRPRISPDGRRVAVEVTHDDQRTEIWIADVERRTASPLAPAAYPMWTPDGRSVVYFRTRSGTRGVFRQAADGTGDPELLLAEARAYDVSRDGVVVFGYAPSPRSDIGTLRLDDGSVSPFLDSSARTGMARFSPDGRWLAYTSNDSGRNEVWVRPFPRQPGVARLVSTDGGSEPAWAPDGSEIYYRSAAGDLMAVPVTLDPTFTSGRPQPLFRYAGVFRVSGTALAYDVHPDGDRFIMVQEIETPRALADRLIVVQNWFETLTAPVR